MGEWRWSRERFFSQLLNNLQAMPVYSLGLYSRETMKEEEKRREKDKAWLVGEEENRRYSWEMLATTERKKGRMKNAGTLYKGRRRNAGMVSVSVMIKRFIAARWEGAVFQHSSHFLHFL